MVVKGIVVAFRRGRHTQRNNFAIVKVDINNLDSLIGKKAILTNGKKKVQGKVVKKFGSGILVRFRKGLDGNVLGKEVEIL